MLRSFFHTKISFTNLLGKFSHSEINSPIWKERDGAIRKGSKILQPRNNKCRTWNRFRAFSTDFFSAFGVRDALAAFDRRQNAGNIRNVDGELIALLKSEESLQLLLKRLMHAVM